jgi:glycosyltransferase involved in cell wall biosynthesis
MSKILIIGPASPLRGGIADLNEAFADSLVKHGHDVEIISFKLQYPKFLFPGKTQYRSKFEPPSNYLISSLISSVNPITWIKTANYIINQNPDKVFIRFWMPFFAPCLGYIAKKIKNKDIPTFSIVDNAIPHENRRGDKVLTNYFLRHCNMHFTLSKKVKDDILSLNSLNRVVTLFHPIYDSFAQKPKKEMAYKKLNLEKDTKYLLFFGLIRSYKGLALALEAMSHPKIKEKSIKLLIAGEFYEDKQKYQSIIDELNLDNIIITDEFIPKSLVPYYFAACNVVLLPYTSATQSGVTQLAMNYECPMIVTNVGGLPEVISDNIDGIIVEPSSHDLADAIINYFSNDNTEKQMRMAMKLKKVKYSWDNFTSLIIEKSI